MSNAPALQRTPLVITAGTLVAGPVVASFRESDPASLLHSYLVLIRQLRGQQREPSITLRAADISALAGHLGSSEERVLDDLLDRMGASRAQRRALAALFAVGALTIVATGSIALELSSAGVSAGGTGDATPVVDVATPVVEVGEAVEVGEVVEHLPLVTTVEQIAPVRNEAVVAVPAATPAVVAVPAAGPTPELAIAGEGADWQLTVALQMLTEALAQQWSNEAIPPPTEGQGVADDGSNVAVAQPPVPPVDGQGVADDGSIVAVGTPPVPPAPAAEGVGVADDGSIVAVGTPPVPPPAVP